MSCILSSDSLKRYVFWIKKCTILHVSKLNLRETLFNITVTHANVPNLGST